MIKGFVFDVDGTLLDTMWMWADIGDRYLKANGRTPETNFSKLIYSMTLNQFAQHIREHYRIDKEVETIIDEICEMVSDFYEYNAEPKKGVPEFLEVLYKNNIPMTVATSSDKSYIQKAFKRLDMNKYFKAVFTCREEKTSKHEPDIYLKAAKALNCEPDKIYVFEDMLHAIKTAKNAGFKVAAVYDAEAEKDISEILEICDLFINDYSELDVSFYPDKDAILNISGG